ncbi:MAG TPA: hypothetical protein DC054_11005 [Blastocatellia bacterium]|nr:hypothetical protein [Blastocatellia bacterium]
MQQQISGGSVPQPVQISTIIALIISSLALALSMTSLYLQRRDKRPRLKLDLERKRRDLEVSETDERGFFKVVETDVMEVRAANPTDKQINILSIEFEPEGCKAFSVPLNSTISEIPSHEARDAIVMWDELMHALEDKQLDRVMKGRFILTDAIGYKHKTKSVTW